jgi:membrane-associated phospholipid phosphatase
MGDRLARRYANNRLLEGAAGVGNALPIVALAASGLAALNGVDDRLSRTGVASLQAGATALLASTGLKYVAGRKRPRENLGYGQFEGFSSSALNSSMPSRHTAMMWAAVTPYAKEYDAPWLYGLAAVTNFARVRDREHWFSDTVAGSLIGYGLGQLFWEWRRQPDVVRKAGEATLDLTPEGVAVSWAM